MIKEKKKKGLFVQQRVKRYYILLGITAAFAILFSFLIPNYVSFDTITNLIRQSSILTILACGMTFVILTGGIDLSIGANIAFTAALAALAINATGSTTVGSAFIGLIVCLAGGVIFGLINGFMVGYLRITAFMATLATMSLGNGLTLYITHSTRIVVQNQLFNSFGIGKFNIYNAQIPMMTIPLILLIILSYILLHKSSFGRKTYIVGGNAMAAKAAGISVPRQIMKVYAYMGLMAGFAAIITIGIATSAQPVASTDIIFDVITAVVLGGISLAGGSGTIVGTLWGCLLMSFMLMGVNMIDIPIYYNYIMKGAFILFAILSDRMSSDFVIRKEIRLGAKKIEEAATLISKSEIEKIGSFDTLTFSHINKYFPGVQALDDVSFNIKSGTVHAIAGENGAGKSTLIKILSGVYQLDSGEILIDGKHITIKSPQDSQKKGISIIYQELTLIPELTAAQNLFLGKEKKGKTGFLIAVNEMRTKAQSIIRRFGIDIDPDKKANMLTIGKQQMIEIARAFDSQAKIVVMDEPTSAISESEKEKLFGLIKELKKQGVTIIYISHRIQELYEIADEVTILRDGKHIITKSIGELDINELIKYMVNREIKDIFSRERAPIGNEVLRVENLSREGVFNNISFTVGKGEVVGMAGLIGAGRTEVARCIYGLDRATSGSIYLNGQKIEPVSTKYALGKGICYVSEDRRREGIIPLMSVRENITVASIDRLKRFGIMDTQQEMNISNEFIKKFEIKTPSDMQPIGNLSGGNQQKCCLARMFACNPRLIIFDEPTRGVDVGAKAEIHKFIEALAKAGIAIIIISSELPEIMGTSDKIIVMAEGHITAILNNKGTTQEEIMKYAAKLSDTIAV